MQATDPAIGRKDIFQPFIVDLTSGLTAGFGNVKCGHRTHTIFPCPKTGQVFVDPSPDGRYDSEASDQDSPFCLHFGCSVISHREFSLSRSSAGIKK
jgi:hypothetical protein